MMTREQALKLRSIIEKAAISLDDKDASEGAILLPRLKGNGELVQAGTRINWNGTVKRAAVDLWDTEANDPEEAPHLWENIYYKQGFRIIPEVITAAGAFSENECGWWDDVLYKSLIPANVHTPAQYPQGWEVVE
jgi:hypothetical protein